MYSDDEFLNAYEGWKMGTHLQTAGVAVTVVVVVVGLVVEIVKVAGGGEGAPADGWLIALGFFVIVPVAAVILCLPINAMAYYSVLRSARRRLRSDIESFRTVVVPAMEDTHGVPGILRRLYRRVGMDPLKRV